MRRLRENLCKTSDYEALQKCCGAAGQVQEKTEFLRTHKRFLLYAPDVNADSLFENRAYLKDLGGEITLLKSAYGAAVFEVRLP
jgi:hypothetical protein